MDTKRRRCFQLEDDNGNILASGVIYDEGNVQILWRVDCGYTAEQYASLNPILDLMPGVVLLRLTDTDTNGGDDLPT
ncbi:hypothetical protein F4212_05625 [Candidatus Poribacteria bacterium]|nr:hypothetical protein [Candidatus Poribacteria bacterium]